MKHPVPISDYILSYLREAFGLDDQEIAGTTVSYDDVEQSLCIDFGDGIKNTPDRTARLMRLLRIPAHT